MFKITSPEDQQKFILPLNRDSEKIYHNQRMIVDAKVETEPVAWLITKIKRFIPNGIARFTLAQDIFDQHHDYIEKDAYGKIIGMWADYYKDDVPLHELNNESIPKNLKSEIIYSGLKPEIKVGGSYKTFTMNYYDENNNVIDKGTYDWKFELNNSPFDEGKLLKVLYPDIKNKLSNNQIKVKFIGSDDYLNSILTIKNENFSLNVKITGM